MALSFSYTYKGSTLDYTTASSNTVFVSNRLGSTQNEITIPNTVTNNTDIYSVISIGNNVFKNTSTLLIIDMSECNALTNIGYEAFMGCSYLNTIRFPTSLVSIRTRGFHSCQSLYVVDFSLCDSLTTFDSNIFQSCSNLQSITIPKNLTNLPYFTFGFCYGLLSVIFNNSTTLSSIGDTVFANCTSLNNIVIPNSVVSIGNNTFGGCRSLPSINIPINVTSIGNNPFDDCGSLININVDPNNINYISENGVLFNKTKTYINSYPAGKINSSYVIPSGVTNLGLSAFSQCKLTSVTFPDTLRNIDYRCFRLSTSLTSISIPMSVTNIGMQTFASCSSLRRVYFNGDLLPTIVSDTFQSIAASPIAYMSESAYTDPRNLTTRQRLLGNSPAFTITDKFTYTYLGATISYTIMDLNSVYVNQYNQGVSGDVTIPSTVTNLGIALTVVKIGDNAFNNCRNLTSISIPSSVTSIGNAAFQECIRLNSISIPNSVTSIGINAFGSCFDLRSVIIPNNVTNLLTFTFGNCLNLRSVIIPNSVTSIGDGVFFSCENMTSVSISNSLMNLGNYSFYSCSSLTSISIPDSVTSIAFNSFQYCTSLSSVSISNNLMSLSDYTFSNCSSLTTISIPNSVTSIGVNLFENCTSLSSVSISNNLMNLGFQMFFNCSSLSTISIPNSVTSIGDETFNNCSSLTIISIPNSVTTIGTSAFESCISLSRVYFYGELLPHIVNDSFYNVAPLPKAYMSETAYFDPNNQTTITLLDNNTPNFITEPLSGTFDYSYEGTTLSYTIIDLNSVYVNGVQSVSENVIIPSTVTNTDLTFAVVSIGVNVFFGSGLTSVTFPDSLTSIGDAAFESNGLTSVTIPNSVTSIGANAFAYNENLESMVLSENAESIPSGMCDGCINLVNVTTANVLMRGIEPSGFSSNITSIGINAFRDTSLNLVDLTNCSLLTSIGNSAFESCSLLTKVVIPSEVTSIGNTAFANNIALIQVYFIGLLLPVIESDTFENIGSSPIAYMSPAAYEDLVNQGTIDSLIAQGFEIVAIPNPCFLEGSKILTDKGYKAIEELRKGDLVKTMNHGYMKIDMIGTKEIYHSCSEERLKDELFRCSTNEYPELTEDLILTGAHSILVDKYRHKAEKEKSIEIIGSVYLIDKKCRLPACIDSRTSVYEIAGMHRIYHLALESNDRHKNYGIYANGLLVESCSKYYLEEKSEMKIIE